MTCNTISLVSRLIWKRFMWKFIDIFEAVCSLHACFSADSFHLLCCITPYESLGRFFRPPGIYRFYPCDAVLSWILAIALCLSVCLSLCHKLEFYRNGWTNRAGFWHGSLKGNLGVSKNKGTSLWNFVPNSRRRKFCFGVSIFEKCYRLSLTMWTLRAW